jgi:uncharacterized membrane protein YdfJ with MMPL/SSD domain
MSAFARPKMSRRFAHWIIVAPLLFTLLALLIFASQAQDLPEPVPPHHSPSAKSPAC